MSMMKDLFVFLISSTLKISCTLISHMRALANTKHSKNLSSYFLLCMEIYSKLSLK